MAQICLVLVITLSTADLLVGIPLAVNFTWPKAFQEANQMQNETPRYCNETGTFIPKEQICDKFQDCPDDSDEINCACNSTYQYPCRNGRCIYKDWLCDGVKDCPQGDDEIPTQCRCGTRSVDAASVGPYILNGQRAARGAWPWQVVVYTGYVSGGQFMSLFICGGILIDSRWILTAAHCTQISTNNSQIGYTGQTKPENIEVLLGTISLNGTDNPDMIIAYADQVHTHPLYDAVEINNDVSLIRLNQTVSFSDTVRPICLPAPDQDLSRFKVCVNTGFGRTLRNTGSEDLLQAKMNVIPDSECQKVNRFYNNVTQICVGTPPTVGDINACSGDSGGPLSCQDPNGMWTAIGVNSYAHGFGDADAPSSDRCQMTFVARVSAFVDWIKTTMSPNTISTMSTTHATTDRADISLHSRCVLMTCVLFALSY